MSSKNKKAATSMVMNTLIAAVIFIPLILIFVKNGGKMILAITEKPKEGTEKSYDRLVLEITRIEEDEKIIPLYIDDKNKIVGFDKDVTIKPKLCSSTSCLCLCSEKFDCTEKGTKKCDSFDENIRFLNGFTLGPETTILNYKLKKETVALGKSISIEKAYTS